jgi:membrane-associated protease RseP (regulator of RpoE activity)
MSFKDLQGAIGIGGPKLAQAAGPIGGGAIAEPIGDERAKWEEEQKQKQQGYKKGGSVKGWGKARGARKAKMY